MRRETITVERDDEKQTSFAQAVSSCGWRAGAELMSDAGRGPRASQARKPSSTGGRSELVTCLHARLFLLAS